MENNKIKAIITYAAPVITFSFGIVKWTPTDLGNFQNKLECYSRDIDFTTSVLQRKDLIYHRKWLAED